LPLTSEKCLVLKNDFNRPNCVLTAWAGMNRTIQKSWELSLGFCFAWGLKSGAVSLISTFQKYVKPEVWERPSFCRGHQHMCGPTHSHGANTPDTEYAAYLFP
jgi:hypothetical protein